MNFKELSEIKVEVPKQDLIKKIREDIKEHEYNLRINLSTPWHRDMYATLSGMKRKLKLLHYIKNLMEFCDKYGIRYQIYTTDGYDPDVWLLIPEEDDAAFQLIINKRYKSIDDVIKKQEEYIKVQEEYIKDWEKKVKAKVKDLALIRYPSD